MDPNVRQAALDNWNADKVRRAGVNVNEFLPTVSPNASLGSTGVGCWGMGHSFWPFAESLVKDYVDENFSHGGIRKLATDRKEWQEEHLVATPSQDGLALREIAPDPTHRTCFQRHPGLCVHKHKAIKDVVLHIAAKLGSIRLHFGC